MLTRKVLAAMALANKMARAWAMLKAGEYRVPVMMAAASSTDHAFKEPDSRAGNSLRKRALRQRDGGVSALTRYIHPEFGGFCLTTRLGNAKRARCHLSNWLQTMSIARQE
jgi:hypothetical protein